MWKKFIIALLTTLVGLITYGIFSSFSFNKTNADTVIVVPTSKQQEVVAEEFLTEEEEIGSFVVENENGTKATYYLEDDACENKCEKFNEDTAQWRYCANVCGIIPIKENQTDCDLKNGLSQDYCLRDSAIIQKNPDACAKIGDTRLRNQCEKRVAEKIIDEL